MGYTCRPLKLHVTSDVQYCRELLAYARHLPPHLFPHLLAPTRCYNLWLCAAACSKSLISLSFSRIPAAYKLKSSFCLTFTLPRTNIVCDCVCICECECVTADASFLAFALSLAAHSIRCSIDFSKERERGRERKRAREWESRRRTM